MLRIRRPGTLRGQIWSMDLMASSVVLMFILLFFIIAWNELSLKWVVSQRYGMLYADALDACDAMFTTPGYPPSWEMLPELNSTSMYAMGLSDTRNEMNNLKMERLRQDNGTKYYNLTRELLGISRYDMYVEIRDIERNVSVFSMGTRQVQGVERLVVSLERFVLVNGTPAVGKMEVYS